MTCYSAGWKRKVGEEATVAGWQPTQIWNRSNCYKYCEAEKVEQEATAAVREAIEVSFLFPQMRRMRWDPPGLQKNNKHTPTLPPLPLPHSPTHTRISSPHTAHTHTTHSLFVYNARVHAHIQIALFIFATSFVSFFSVSQNGRTW